MKYKDRERMQELGEALCEYCYRTEYGKLAMVHTPNGVSMCEGVFCEEAYQAYLEENETEAESEGEG